MNRSMERAKEPISLATTNTLTEEVLLKPQWGGAQPCRWTTVTGQPPFVSTQLGGSDLSTNQIH